VKRVLTAITLTVAGLAALLGFRTRDPLAAVPSTTTVAAGSTTTATAGTVQADGPTVGTPYGPVQVQVTIGGGRLVDVVALQLPGGNGESYQINAYAAPRLREMALQAQSANIDVVSGATFTSRAYAESLQGALDAAGF
jgi:uncharacterized protein with FMN-binding domain